MANLELDIKIFEGMKEVAKKYGDNPEKLKDFFKEVDIIINNIKK